MPYGKNHDLRMTSLSSARLALQQTKADLAKKRAAYNATPTPTLQSEIAALQSQATTQRNTVLTLSGLSTSASAAGASLTFETTPLPNSKNPITSGGVHAALVGKQDILTTDTNLTVGVLTTTTLTATTLASLGTSTLSGNAVINGTLTGTKVATTSAAIVNDPSMLVTAGAVHAALATKQDALNGTPNLSLGVVTSASMATQELTSSGTATFQGPTVLNTTTLSGAGVTSTATSGSSALMTSEGALTSLATKQNFLINQTHLTLGVVTARSLLAGTFTILGAGTSTFSGPVELNGAISGTAVGTSATQLMTSGALFTALASKEDTLQVGQNATVGGDLSSVSEKPATFLVNGTATFADTSYFNGNILGSAIASSLAADGPGPVPSALAHTALVAKQNVLNATTDVTMRDLTLGTSATGTFTATGTATLAGNVVLNGTLSGVGLATAPASGSPLLIASNVVHASFTTKQDVLISTQALSVNSLSAADGTLTLGTGTTLTFQGSRKGSVDVNHVLTVGTETAIQTYGAVAFTSNTSHAEYYFADSQTSQDAYKAFGSAAGTWSTSASYTSATGLYTGGSAVDWKPNGDVPSISHNLTGDWVAIGFPDASVMIPSSFSWTAPNVTSFVWAGSNDFVDWAFLSNSNFSVTHNKYRPYKYHAFLIRTVSIGSTSATVDNLVIHGYPAISQSLYLPHKSEVGLSTTSGAPAQQLVVNGEVLVGGKVQNSSDVRLCDSVGTMSSTDYGGLVFYRQIAQPLIWRTSVVHDWTNMAGATEAEKKANMDTAIYSVVLVIAGPFIQDVTNVNVVAVQGHFEANIHHNVYDCNLLNASGNPIQNGEKVDQIRLWCRGGAAAGNHGPRRTNIAIFVNPLYA